jgi:hypothetical protein
LALFLGAALAPAAFAQSAPPAADSGQSAPAEPDSGQSASAAPEIQFQKTFGGGRDERARSIQRTQDGGFIVIGDSGSNDGDASGNHNKWGRWDIWAAKLSALGELEWRKMLGGSGAEQGGEAREAAGGGYIAIGSTESNDGDVSGFHGRWDMWVVKLTASGDIEWERALGGSGHDGGESILEAPDGGYLAFGTSGSDDGDLAGVGGGDGFWFVKLTSSGGTEWQRRLSGGGLVSASSVLAAKDGGYIAVGTSRANGGGATGSRGGSDIWAVKLTSGGELEWQKRLGGSDSDFGEAVCGAADGGFVIVGGSYSDDGDAAGSHGGQDAWALKLSAEGGLEWQRQLGGGSYDAAYSAAQAADGGFVIVGTTESSDGDVSGHHGGRDAWALKLSADGELEWQKALGGAGDDWAGSVAAAADGGVVIAGSTESGDGGAGENRGGSDFWVVKLAPEATSPK